jgi:hypothetical protein
MNIISFLGEAQQRTLDSYDAADLRRGLRELSTRYRETCSARESTAGYLVGEQRLITLRNEAALATIKKQPDYREKILDLIVRYVAEATATLRGAKHLRSSDADQADEFAIRRRAVPLHHENVGARIPAGRWADTAQSLR